jgi:hypothetical protein
VWYVALGVTSHLAGVVYMTSWESHPLQRAYCGRGDRYNVWHGLYICAGKWPKCMLRYVCGVV